MKTIWLFLSLTLLTSCLNQKNLQQNEAYEYPHYDIHLTLDPEQQLIKVEGSLMKPVEEEQIDTLSLLLHKQLMIKSFSVNNEELYQIDTSGPGVRWIPEAIEIIHPFKEPNTQGEVIEVDFSYEGVITEWPGWSANVIGEDWTEMGLYFPWYPSVDGLFTYRLTVSSHPDYKVFAMGSVSHENDTWIFETEYPVIDMIVCASKDLAIQTSTFNGYDFNIVNTYLSDETIDELQQNINQIYGFYTKWFGEIDLHDMSLVVSKRARGGGYARKGGLFLAGITDADEVVTKTNRTRYLAHEIAHFWWTGAESNYEDWLNESFAEFSALLIIRECVGIEEYQSRIMAKEKASQNTPAIIGFDRNDAAATLVLYSKGVVLLHELYERIGHDGFMELCKERILRNILSTHDLLDLIENQEGSQVREWFEEMLKTK